MLKDLFPMHKKERYTDCTRLYRTVPDCTETVPPAETVRRWYEKQAENSTPERWRAEKVLIFVVLLTIATAAAYMGRDAVSVLLSVLTLSAFSIAADPLRLTRRKLSRNSRLITAAGLLPLFVVMGDPTPRTIAVAAVVFVAAAAVAYKGNGHWRAAESYRMSRHVLKALQPTDNTDHRDACETSWQADGAREVVAAAAEMGAYDCKEIEWAVRKAAYTIGFCRASTITRKHEKERTEAAWMAQEARQEADSLRAELEAVHEMAENLEEYRARMKAADRAAVEAARAINENMKAQDEIRKLQRQVERLEEANDTLLKTADNPLIAAEAAEQLTKQRLQEAAEKNFSVSQTEAYAGVSHRRAQYFLKEWREKNVEKNGEKSEAKKDQKKAG